jgi:adenylate cyclase
VRQLQRQATSLAHFFSPAVREAVSISDADVALAPRQTQVSVLFCDLRGFSRHSEQSADDLFGLLRRVSEALGIVTHQILEQGGVIGDFHGDAAMGFWGWPLEQPDLVERACRAALHAYAGFRNASADQLQPDLAGFRVGLGLATGQAVAGRIGTIDQVKVTVFGPVVNVASRLEGLTRAFGTPILIDEVTAGALGSARPPLEAGLRAVATVRPQGMDRSMRIYELVPAPEALYLTTGRHQATYAQALEAFERGDWISAREGFSTLADKDYAADFLLRYMERCRFQPPPPWDGVLNYVPGK